MKQGSLTHTQATDQKTRARVKVPSNTTHTRMTSSEAKMKQVRRSLHTPEQDDSWRDELLVD